MKYSKQIFFGVLVVIVFAAYALYSHMSSGSPSVVPVSSASPSSSLSGTSGTASSGATSTASVGAAGAGGNPNTPSAYKDGTYTGTVADAYFGNLQVAAVIKNGSIADVQFLQYPNDKAESIQVNTMSNPKLKAEAIAAQSANVDIVSGATQSSEAFQQSLASALAQAKS